MEMKLLSGRTLTDRDQAERPIHVVVNETLVRKYFDGRDPIGQRIGYSKDLGAATVPEANLMEIVGVVRDAKYTSVRQPPPPTVFRPYEAGAVTFEVRTVGDPLALAASVREAVRQVDKDLSLQRFQTQRAIAELTFARERHFAWLASGFGVVALALACIGLYGLMSYNVANRTREIGVRMALGAEWWKVVRLVTAGTLATVAIGIAIGLASAAGLTRLIASMLFGLTPTDVPTIAAAVALMAVVAVLAAYLPARRAARVSPVVALRHE
jgi:predicted permease